MPILSHNHNYDANRNKTTVKVICGALSLAHKHFSSDSILHSLHSYITLEVCLQIFRRFWFCRGIYLAESIPMSIAAVSSITVLRQYLWTYSIQYTRMKSAVELYRKTLAFADSSFSFCLWCLCVCVSWAVAFTVANHFHGIFKRSVKS